MNKHIFGFYLHALVGLSLSGLSLAKELPVAAAEKQAVAQGLLALQRSEAAITEQDLRRYVTRLSSAEYEGRGTGDLGEKMATAYLARYWKGLGLKPDGDGGTYFQSFEFGSAKNLQGKNAVTVSRVGKTPDKITVKIGTDYLPLPFSTSGEVEAAPVVFAGFGIQTEDYDSFQGLEVKGRWVMVLRGHPKDQRQFGRHSSLVAKANLAKQKGAKGIILVKGGNPAIRTELIKLNARVGGRGDILPAITVTDVVAEQLLASAGQGEVFAAYADQKKTAGFELPLHMSAQIGLQQKKEKGRNVIARLMVGDRPSKESVVIGGHIDHIGHGNRGGSRARGENANKAHLGADDNASGVAALMEISQHFMNLKKSGKLNLKRDIIFAAWSGEEMGLFGSTHFVEQKKAGTETAYPEVVAYLNMDMVGRFKENGVTIHGTASSKAWKDLLAKVSQQTGMKPTYEPSPYLPSDTRPFYAAGVPVLAAFTGLHDDYHTPADTVDKIDFKGLYQVANYMRILTSEVAALDLAPKHVQVPRPGRGGNVPRVRLGIMPENANDGGVTVTQVVDGAPAQKAGIQVNDVIRKIDDNEVANIRQLFAALMQLKPGKECQVTILRDDKELKLKMVPVAR